MTTHPYAWSPRHLRALKQFFVYGKTCESYALTTKQLAEYLELSTGTAARLCNDLRDNEFLLRSVGNRDGAWTLTDAGLAKIKASIIEEVPADVRNRQLAMIHVAKKELGLDEDLYRAILWEVCGVESSKDLDLAGRNRLLEHFREKGFKSRMSSFVPETAPLAKPKRLSPVSRDKAHKEQKDKIRALWIQLHRAGAVKDGSETALCSWLKKRTGIDSPEWLPAEIAQKQIKALNSWLALIKKKKAEAVSEV